MDSCSTPASCSAPSSCSTPAATNATATTTTTTTVTTTVSTGNATAPVKPNTTTPTELHGCMGLNACKGHDRYGDNSCAGTGFCATVTHTCHSLNNCRGQGGCGLYGDSKQQNHPGDNPCAWLGSCATPINSERFSTVGPNKNKSVWKRARKIFEERMEKTGRQYGPSPFAEGPPAWWLHSVGSYTACGASGMSGGGSCS